MKLELDSALCEGHGMCEMLAPKFFAVDDDGVLTLLATEVSADEEKLVRDAVRSCPVNALRLVP